MNASADGSTLPGGLEPVPTDDAVLAVLASEFGWVSAYAVIKRLPLELQDEAMVEASLRRLTSTGKVLIRERHGNTDLFRFPPRPGEEATAEVRPDPAPRVVKYSGAAGDQIPPRRGRGQRLTLQPPARTSTYPAAPQETTMRITKDQVLQQLASGPKSREEIAKALKCSEAAPGYHLAQLLKERKVHNAEGRMGPWALLNGKGASVTTPAPAEKPSGRRAGKARVEDLDLKLLVLANHIAVAEDAGRTITAHVLHQIRADLERAAA